MGKLITPETYFVGYTVINQPEMDRYLRDTDNEDFLSTMKQAREEGLSDGEILTSFFAKLCYATLSEGKNKNVKRIRNIPDNLKGATDSGHGSVFEHANLNFVTTNCSRVFTHELVRHRVGTAFSQTSGRYVRGDEVDVVFDPILEPVKKQAEALQGTIEFYYRQMVAEMGLEEMTDFDLKKQITSALRRLLPNGQSNEIGFSLNLRSLRHLIQIRTSRHAEWEIRLVFNQVYQLVREKYPTIFAGAKVKEVKGLLEISGIKMQPYETTAE